MYEELQTSSLSLPEDSLTATDLDALARTHHLATQRHETLAPVQHGAQDAQRLGLEVALLRDHVADLTSAMARTAATHQAESASLILHSTAQTELDLVRSQLNALSQSLTQGLHRPNQISQTQTQTTPEVTLLRDQLAAVTALLHSAPAPDTRSHPDRIQIESAFATLLTALVNETDLRLQAQPILPAPALNLDPAPLIPQP